MAYSLKNVAEKTMPIGSIVAFYGTSPPSGWLICDGRSCAVTRITNALEKVNKISGYTFTMLGTGKRQAGVIAQEVEKVLPEVVSKNENGYLTVMYGNIISLLIGAVKELSNEVQELKGGR